MNLDIFFSRYADEQSCKLFFKEKRAEEHRSCKQCGSLSVKWLEKENRWRCKECKHPMGLKKGTVMENSNLGYKVWLWGLYLMSVTQKGFSALEVQRLIGHRRYEPIWLMLQKIRLSMGQRDDQYILDGYIEMDEGFFEGHRKKNVEPNNAPPVKELDRQVKAIVAVSTIPVDANKQKKHKDSTKPKYLKMNVVKSLSNKDAEYEVSKMLCSSATVKTDGKSCYNVLKKHCVVHQAIVVRDKTQVSKIFPWVHKAISNAKKKILGLHHQVKDEYMQNYLNEFCYKFNRRFFGLQLFDRLLVACLLNPWYKPNYG